MDAYNMIRDIREQPKNFADILQMRSRIVDITRAISEQNPPRGYYAVGCGSSYYSAMVGAFYHEYMFGLNSRAMPSSEFVWYAPIPDLTSLVLIALSKSGKTSETIEAARKAKRMKVPTIALTADSSSTLGQECDYCLDIGIGHEQRVMTKSFTVNSLCSILIGWEFAKRQGVADLRDFESKLKRLPSEASTVIQNVEDQAKKVAEVMRKLDGFVFLGSGANYGFCLDGALKVMETSNMPSEAYHTIELRHGPLAHLGKGTGVIVVVPNDKTINPSDAIIEQIVTTGATVIPISNVPKIVDFYENSIRMPEISLEFAPILFMIPIQMIAYYNATQRGLNPDNPRNLGSIREFKFVTTDTGT
jgi:glucosamine--fructose-6-phosphate aminotransferase (isomerizing)